MQQGDLININTLNIMGVETCTEASAVHKDFRNREDILVFKRKHKDFGLAIQETEDYYRVLYYRDFEYKFGIPEMNHIKAIGNTNCIAVGLSGLQDSAYKKELYIWLFNTETQEEYHCKTIYIDKNYVYLSDVPNTVGYTVKVLKNNGKAEDVTDVLLNKLGIAKIRNFVGAQDGVIVNVVKRGINKHAIIGEHLDLKKVLLGTYVNTDEDGGQISYYKNLTFKLEL